MQLSGVLIVVSENFAQSFPDKLVSGLFFAHFEITNDSVLGDVSQVQADESVIGISTGTIQAITVVDGVAAFRSASLVHDFFELDAVPGDGWVEPGIGVGFDVDRRADCQLGFADFAPGTLVDVSDIDALSVTMRISLDGADVNVRTFDLVVLVVAHTHSAGTQRSSVGIGVDASLFQPVRINLLALPRKRDHGNDIFFLEIIIMSIGIMMAVADENINTDFQAIFPGGFEQTVESI